jgi:hypothetical protein
MVLIQKTGERDRRSAGRMNARPFRTESGGSKLTNNHINQTKP